MGHLEGITFVDSRNDGRYFISNGKDQTIKLWDIRKMSSNATRYVDILPLLNTYILISISITNYARSVIFLTRASFEVYCVS